MRMATGLDMGVERNLKARVQEYSILKLILLSFILVSDYMLRCPLI